MLVIELADAGRDGGELAGQRGAKGSNGGDDRDSDQSCDETVLDRRGAFFFSHKSLHYFFHRSLRCLCLAC